MSRPALPISRLFVDACRDHSELVAVGANGAHNWGDSMRAVATLATHLASRGGHRWLIVEDDPYALAVGLLGALHANGIAILPASLQSGHLMEASKSVDGVISTTYQSTGSSKIIHPFSIPSDGLDTLEALDPDRSKIILHTSGTTGIPTQIVKPLRCLDAEIAVQTTVFPPVSGSLVLATVPAHHIYGLLFRILCPIATDRPFSTDQIAYPEQLTAAVKRYPGSTLVSSPAFLKRALPLLDLESLRKDIGPIYSSGGPLAPSIAEAYNAILIHPIIEVYGSTETGGIAHRTVRDADAVPQWLPLPGVDIRVDTEDRRLYVMSPFLTETTWFLTNDRAEIGPDGRFELQGRADRIVKIEERRVSLIEIEKQLLEFPGVASARVIPLPSDETTRQILGAVVEPTSDGWEMLAKIGKTQLTRALLDTLTPYFPASVTPRKWRFVTRMPEDDRGKTSDAALVAIFDTEPVWSDEPDILDLEVDGYTAELRMQLPSDLSHFEGHFDEAPILPGVVQLHWAIEWGMRYFDIDGIFRRVEAMKFFNILTAENIVTLQLRYDPAAARLYFSYLKDATKFSSGRVIFEAKS